MWATNFELFAWSDWKAADWAGKEEEYTYVFTPQDIAELAAAVVDLKNRNVVTEEDIQV